MEVRSATGTKRKVSRQREPNFRRTTYPPRTSVFGLHDPMIRKSMQEFTLDDCVLKFAIDEM